jgi:uncharacterized protein involved in tolerance to divalent cations
MTKVALSTTQEASLLIKMSDYRTAQLEHALQGLAPFTLVVRSSGGSVTKPLSISLSEAEAIKSLLKPEEDHYLLTVTEVNGEHEYDCKVLVVCSAESSDRKFEEVIETFRGDGAWEDEDKHLFLFSDGLAAKFNDSKQISREEYLVMSKYLATL